MSIVFVNSNSTFDFYRIIAAIIKEVEDNISKNTLLTNFKMSPLLILCKKFVELMEILVSYDATLKYLLIYYFRLETLLLFPVSERWRPIQARCSGAFAARYARSCH